MEIIKIIIAGPRGKMGREAVNLVKNTENFQLVAVIDHKNNGFNLYDIDPSFGIQAPIYSDCEQCFTDVAADVLIDLTTPEAGKVHTEAAIRHGIRPVVGTTGFSKEDLTNLEILTKEKAIGCIIAPNFAVGAVLMMKFSQMAAKYYEDIEIIELHHDQKLDAPSGTAVKTAEMIASQRQEKKQGHSSEKETLKGARGADYQGMRIHSVRLPGLVAHQQVMFGGSGETLTIRHDSYNRGSFMNGIKLSVETVMNLNELIYGLENILD